MIVHPELMVSQRQLASSERWGSLPTTGIWPPNLTSLAKALPSTRTGRNVTRQGKHETLQEDYFRLWCSQQNHLPGRVQWIMEGSGGASRQWMKWGEVVFKSSPCKKCWVWNELLFISSEVNLPILKTTCNYWVSLLWYITEVALPDGKLIRW